MKEWGHFKDKIPLKLSKIYKNPPSISWTDSNTETHSVVQTKTHLGRNKFCIKICKYNIKIGNLNSKQLSWNVLTV